MTPLVLIAGLFSGCFVSVLVGLIGRNRNIGFGWAFILSLLLTPIIGLLITLISDPLPSSQDKSWGCIGFVMSVIGALLLIPLIIFLVALVTMLFVA